MVAKRIAPGLHRQFAFEGWPAFQSKRWAYLRQTAQKAVTQLTRPIIFASDRSLKATSTFSNCVQNHEFSDAINIEEKDFFDLNPADWTSTKGIVVLNPPYGIRLNQERSTGQCFSELVHKLKSDYQGWRVALLIPQNAAKSIRPLSLKSTRLNHGGLAVLLLYGKIR